MGDSRNKTLKNSMVDVKTAELAQAVADNMFDEVMRFQMENAGIRKNELVNEFLKAELSVCRMLQGITRVIADSVELDTDFL